MDRDFSPAAQETEETQGIIAEESGALRLERQSAAEVLRAPTGQFVKGTVGPNPNGRPKGSRNKLGEAFVADLYEHWKANGVSVLARAAAEKPADYLKVVASILPRDIKVSLETMSDGELQKQIDRLTQSLGLRLLPAAGVVTDLEDDGATA